MDLKTLERIEKLHPLVREEARQIYDECNRALTGKATIRFTQTLRTFAEQDDLYAQGRTREGKKITWARGGQSYHNYGLAIDFCLISKDFREVYWNTLKDYDADGVPDWYEVVRIFERYGWEAGFRWERPKTDPPHFQKTFGLSTKAMLALYKNKKNAYIDIA